MSTLKINDVIANRYLLKKLIGVGGYSQVWLATDSKSGNLEIAIKIFAPGQGLDEKGLELFSKEYSLVFNLNHPGLLKPTYFDDFEGSPYLVMQYCNQGSVFGKIGDISEMELARFIQQVTSALNYLHTQDPPIIHQDIKPDNVLVDSHGNYLLSDFGISSKIRRTLTKSMGAIASTGTLAYMPPEKFSADKQIIKAGDIFSLGVTIYELLTGDLPFGDHGGMVILTGAQVPNLPSGFNPELNSVLKQCMSKEPWERPTAEQLEELAGKFLQTGQWPEFSRCAPKSLPESPKGQEQPRGGRKTEPIPLIQPEAPSHAESQYGPIKKNNHFLWIIAVTLVVIVMAAIAILWPTGPTAKQIEETRIADSIRLADSLAMVQAEQQRIADSIAMESAQVETQRMAERVKVGQTRETGIAPVKRQHFEDNSTTAQNGNLRIGDRYAGGIIFYLDRTGEHGKVCAEQDQSTKATWEQAKTICNNLNLNGYRDWYLPSSSDLNKMYEYLYKYSLGSFAYEGYWSTGESSANFVRCQYFHLGYQSLNDKNFPYYVRAIRDF